MTYKKLSDLTTKGKMWNIKMRVIRVWDSYSKKISEFGIQSTMQLMNL